MRARAVIGKGAAGAAGAALAERQRLAAEREEAARKAEAAAAQQVTERTQRRAGRLLWGIAALVLAMLGGTLWQARETDKREVLIYTSLAATAIDQDRHDRAMRFALQAYPPPGTLPWAPFSTEL